MGCASSRGMHIQAEREESCPVCNTPTLRARKRMRGEEEEEQAEHHVVALTSSTYGVLEQQKPLIKVRAPPSLLFSPRQAPAAPPPAEVINTAELMKGLEDDHPKKAAGLQLLLRDMHSSNSSSSTITYERAAGEEFLQQCTSNKKLRRCPSSKASNSLCVKKEEDEVTTGNVPASSSSVFDPELLESIERAFEQISEEDWNSTRDQCAASTSEGKAGEGPESGAFHGFKPLCPPGGESRAVFYYTSLRGVRSTHEKCATGLEILRSYGVSIDERDVSMHLAFRRELQEMSGETNSSSSLPMLFIKGRLIGGFEEIWKLHEEGRLAKLLQGLNRDEPGKVCDGCGGARFVLCLDCSGSRKVLSEDGERKSQCVECNENGLIRCPICC